MHHLGEAGSPYQDATANNRDGAEATNSPTATTGKVGGGQDFVAASNDRYSVASPSLPTGDFNYEAWVRPDAATSETVFDASNGTSANKLALVIDGGVEVYTNGSLRMTTSTTLSPGTMYHLVTTRSGSTIRAYINGVQDATTGTDAGALSFSTCSVFVGTDVSSFCGSPTSNA